MRRTAWARARTPSITPASPPRLAPVSDNASARSWACTPRARCQASAAGKCSSPPRTARIAPTRSVGQGTPRPARSTTRSPSSLTVATRTPNERERGASRSTTRSCTACPMRGASRVASIASRRACATRAPATTAPVSARRTAAREPSAGAASAASGTASGARGPRSRPATSAAVPTCHGRERSSSRAAAARARQSGARRTRVPASFSAAAPLTAGPCPSGRPGASGRCPGSRRGRRSSESRRAAGGTRGSCWRWPGRRRRACRAARPSRC